MQGVAKAFDYTKAEFIRDKFAGKKIAIFYKFQAEYAALLWVFGSRIEIDAAAFNKAGNNAVFVSQIVSGREGLNLSSAAAAMRYADAMLRERCRAGADCPLPDNAPNHDAAPAARASVDSVAPQPTTDGRERTDKSPARTVDGTGESDRPKPIKSTPATHATHGEGSVRREGIQEPAAWGVAGSKGLLYATSISRMDAVDMQSDYAYHTEIVPLYRVPTLTDAEREAVEYYIGTGGPTAVDAALRRLVKRHGAKK